MRPVVTLALVLAVALPAVAEDRFVLDLSAIVPPLELDEVRDSEPIPEALKVMQRQDEELRLALWSSPLGRVTYDYASLQSTLGREGIVGGEHMLGANLSMAAFGAAPSQPGVIFPSSEHPWRDFSTREKLEAAAYSGILAALLYQMVQMAD